MIAGIGM
jgi:hypothetical protein